MLQCNMNAGQTLLRFAPLQADEGARRPTARGNSIVNNVIRKTILSAGIALAMTGSAFAGNDNMERVLVKLQPGTRGHFEGQVHGAGGQVHHRFDDLGVIAISVPSQALQGLRNNPNVIYIEEDAVRQPLAQSMPYGINMVQAPEAWAAGKNGDGAFVCIIDSGINPNHEDYAGLNIVGGYPSGWNYDSCGHGTHVAGTIASRDDNVGVVGVARGNVDLYIVKVFGGNTADAGCGWTYTSSLIDAANRCKAAADAAGKKLIINMSLGGSTASTTERSGFQSLYDQGVLSIAAAGNDGNTTMSYPASYDSVMSVAAIDSNKAWATFSQYNSQVEIAAPGVGVLSTLSYADATLSVDSASYMVSAMTGTFKGTASAALVDGGRCSATNSAWSGKVVLCERGDISFATKMQNVQNSGGKAALIYNNVAGSFGGTVEGTTSTIPTQALSQEDGLFLKANKLGATANVSTVLTNPANGYAAWDGTSMATPHVAGVAAVLWSAFPNATNAQIRDAINKTAQDLGTAGRDTKFGFGLVQTKAALDYLAGNGGGGGTEPPPSNTSKVDSVTMAFTQKGKNYQALATVKVSANGTPLASASVTGCFSGAVSGCGTGTTNSTGQVTFQSGSFKNRAEVKFCVSNVQKTGVTFDGVQVCGSGTP